MLECCLRRSICFSAKTHSQRGFQLTGSPVAHVGALPRQERRLSLAIRRYFGNQHEQVAILDVREGRCLPQTLSSLTIRRSSVTMRFRR